MWTWSVIGAVIGCVLVLCAGGVLMWQSRRITAQQAEIALVHSEEQRVFAFLHGLGEVFSSEIRTSDLHRMLAEGVIEVLEAQGGGLFLVNQSGDGLYCAYLSENCPSLVEVPEHVLAQASVSEVHYDTYVKFHLVKPESGMLGKTWQRDQAVALHGNELKSLARQMHPPGSVLAAPLMFGNKNLGVIVVANEGDERPFCKTDFEVFKAVAEQSAFALYNALIYSEAGKKRRMDRDLRTAREIQSILRPASSPGIDGYEIIGASFAAQYVSGDYFDYITIDEDHLGIVIADVSGKGVPAALIAAMCRSVVRSLAHSTISPAAVLSQVNRLLYPDMKEDMFISMAYVVIDHREDIFTLARAGHDAPLYYNGQDRSIIRLNPKGMALGIDSGDVFDRVIRDFSVNLGHKDAVILYTDGVTEALNSAEAEFGVERLQQAVHSGADGGAEGIVETLSQNLQEFVGDEPQYDDVTIIAIRKV